VLVERGDQQRQGRLGHTRTRGHRRGKRGEPLVLEQRADERVQNGTVHDERRDGRLAAAQFTA
jgi:hypothetical protein